MLSDPAAVITQEDVGLVSEAGDRFGAAVTIGNVAGDACSDLVIGVPGEDDGTGQVVVVPGSATGLQPSGAVVLRQGLNGAPGQAEAGDTFGASLAIGPSASGTMLLVGAPMEDLGSAVDAGSVTRFELGGTLPPEQRRRVHAGHGRTFRERVVT